MSETGFGIYDNRFRNAMLRLVGVFAGCVFVAAGVVTLFDARGNWMTTAFFWVFGILIVAIPMSLGAKHNPPTTRIIADEYGTFLAKTSASNGRLVVFIGLAAVFYAITIGGIVRGFTQSIDINFVGALVITVGLGAFFTHLTVRALREPKAVQAGIFLTQTGIHFRERMQPFSLEWQEISRVYAHWVKFKKRGQPVSNWLTFERFDHAGTGSSPEVYRDVHEFFSGTGEPSIDLGAFSGDPRKIVSGIEYYLKNAPARNELGTSAALKRFN